MQNIMKEKAGKGDTYKSQEVINMIIKNSTNQN
jgi:hypothetical protein